jgi:ADP-heptose:LPS heptosyltransferase
MKKLLIINFQGMGNTILMLPLLHAINESKKYSNVTMVIQHKVIKDLIDPLEVVDEFIIYNHFKEEYKLLYSRLNLLLFFLKNKFHTAVNIEARQNSMTRFLMFFVRASQKIGVNACKPFLFPYNTNVNYEFTQSEKELYKSIGEVIDSNMIVRSIYEKDTFIKERLVFKKDSLSCDKNFIGIHPGSGTTMMFKRWPLSYYVKFCKLILRETNQNIVVFGGPGEELLANSILDQVKNSRVKSLAGIIPIGQTATLISRCTVFISNDSGLMHLAGILGVPLIAIFGPTSVIKNEPYYDEGHIISRSKCGQNNSMCQDCSLMWKLNDASPACLMQITPEFVFNKVKNYV